MSARKVAGLSVMRTVHRPLLFIRHNAGFQAAYAAVHACVCTHNLSFFFQAAYAAVHNEGVFKLDVHFFQAAYAAVHILI